jgi:transcriptional regulator with XRE-family HTH domain
LHKIIVNNRRGGAVDIAVGRRVRVRRLMLRLSQGQLADAIGVTFQQVQKYETGANRIGAGRLRQIADKLEVPVSFFFEAPVAVSEDQHPVLDFLNTANALRLVKAFSRIRDKKVQHGIIELVEHIADEGEG